MSKRLTGRLADEQGRGLVGLRVTVRMGGLFGFNIGSAFSITDGFFEIEKKHHNPNFLMDLIVQDGVGREVGRFSVQDEEGEVLSKGDFTIRRADAEGFLVTLGTGQFEPDQNGTRGWGLVNGCTVTFLMDQDAFKKAAELFTHARDQILVSQLFFPVPTVFVTDATRETTKLIFDFHTPEPDANNLRAAGVGDARPERLLLQAADRDVDVRILLHAFKVPLFIKIIAGALVFPFAGSDGVRSVVSGLLDADLTDTDEDRRYFKDAGRTGIKVQAFQQPVLSAGVMHAKLMVVDAGCAVSIGSPFGQSYIDTHEHAIDAPVRGDSEGLPKHDAGFIAKGPVIRVIYETLKLLWDTATPEAPLESFPPTPPLSHHGPSIPDTPGDAVCSMQIVRTLSSGRFDKPDEGEKGILEGYLRAINNAADFIYLETQYFTNDAIGEALVAAMKRNTKLQTILLLNIEPDVPFYPFKQRRLIHRIREGIGQGPNDPVRFGVFTRWSHLPPQPPAQTRPRLLPIYIHAKVGIVDDAWATVGSANLDGLSLDSCLVGDILNEIIGPVLNRNVFREQRAIEVNALMFNDVDGQPASDVARILRRKLWAEHLGFSNGEDPKLVTRDPQDGWIKLWNERADATLKQLIKEPAKPLKDMAQVLPWPKQNTTYKTPRKHLNALGIDTSAIVPLKGTRAFDFESGDWKAKSKAAMDYD